MNLKQDTKGIIHQICSLLKQMDNEMYSRPLDIYSGSTVGQHIRHIYEFYVCLLNGINEGTVNYDKRKRDMRVQTETCYCETSFKELLSGIKNFPLTVNVKVKQGMHTADMPEELAVNSSSGRELMYAFEHAIHHLAIVKMGLKAHFPNFDVDSNLGVAPSTIEYRKTCVQ